MKKTTPYLKKLNNILKVSALLTINLVLFTSCELFQIKNEQDSDTGSLNDPIARVQNIYLYPSDLSGIVPKGISKNDSIDIIERHIKSWIKKQLLISEAQKQLSFDEANLERKVLDYRYALMMHEFEKYNVNRNLDTNISDEEIVNYYNENLDNFELNQNIVRGLYIQLDKKAPKIDRFKKLLWSSKEGDMEELQSYCYQFAVKSYLDDSVWMNFDDIINNTPLMNIPNKVEFLRKNKYIETNDDKFVYFIKIDEYRIQNEKSPLEFVRDEIQKIILNKRKVNLAKKLEEEIYQKAVENEEFEIYERY